MSTTTKRNVVVVVLLLCAIALMVPIYYSPIWWVSLTAPNYPKEAFPDGIRIHFHLNGVYSGGKLVEKAEIVQDEALDHVHEMDTINHYVGMYPIASGGVIELAFALFALPVAAVLLLGFMCVRPRPRMVLMAVGFAAIAVWMAMTWYGRDGLRLHNTGYVAKLAIALDQDTEEESDASRLTSGEALIARLKASLDNSEATTDEPDRVVEKSEKESSLDHLRAAFLEDQERRPEAEREEWNGSGAQVVAWHYQKSLARYFNNPDEIEPMVAVMTRSAHVAFGFVLFIMVLFIFGARKDRGLLYWLMVLIPIMLPFLFVLVFAAWLGWYGHNLNDMGAFTLKPFMPTVFGQGKVAQFTTSSYPHYGFGVMLLFSLLVSLAALTRRKQLREQKA